MEGWGEFFVAEVGAAAALAGLLFVAISINVEKILALPTLPGRGAQTLIIVSGALTTGCVGLLPGLPVGTFGLVALIVSSLVACSGIVQVRSARHIARTGGPVIWMLLPVIMLALAALPGIIGGALLIGGNAAGVYVVAIGCILSLLCTLLGGWVLLIEILR